METIQVNKSFILEAHAAACQDLKSKIEKELPELFEEKFKVGDWVVLTEKYGKLENGDIIIKRKQLANSSFWVVDRDGESSYRAPYDYIMRLATPSEIEKHLIALAEKKYRLSDKIKGLTLSHDRLFGFSITGTTQYFPNEDRLRWRGTDVYVRGKWAEIIEEPFIFTGKIMTAEIEGKKFQVKIIEEVK